MTAREYLLRIRSLEGEIRRIDREIRKNRDLLDAGRGSYDVAHVPRAKGDRTAAVLADVADLERRQVSRRADLQKLRDKIITEVSAVPRYEHSEVLYQVYVLGLGLSQVARNLHYSHDWVRHLHTEALRVFGDLFRAEIEKSRRRQ